MDQLDALHEIVAQFEKGSLQGKPISPECTINLENTDSSGTVVQSHEIPLSLLKHVLDYLSFENAPFGLVRDVLNAMLSLFYPADDQVSDAILQ